MHAIEILILPDLIMSLSNMMDVFTKDRYVSCSVNGHGVNLNIISRTAHCNHGNGYTNTPPALAFNLSDVLASFFRVQC